jgi:hypothetical protein
MLKPVYLIINLCIRKCKRAVLLLFFLFCIFFINAQYGTKAQLRNIKFELTDNKVIINYDLVDAKRKDLFDIKIDIYNSGGYKIDAKSYEGDFSDVRRGKKKQIKWYIGEDYLNFEDNIYIELTAIHKNYLIIKKISRIEAVGKSTLWPGWGSAQMTLEKSNYIKGIFAYGFIGASIFFNDLKEQEQFRFDYPYSEDRQEYYSKNIKLYRNLCHVSLGIAGFIWIWEYATIIFKPNISKNIRLDTELGYINNNYIPMLSINLNL